MSIENTATRYIWCLTYIERKSTTSLLLGRHPREEEDLRNPFIIWDACMYTHPVMYTKIKNPVVMSLTEEAYEFD